MFGLEWSALYEAPRDILGRLRAIRPNAELLYQGEGVWMLGERRWNFERYRKGILIVAQFWRNIRDHGQEIVTDPHQVSFLREGQLMIGGFVWIRDYTGVPDGRIVQDYARMCWKEDHGLLDADFRQMAHESDDQTSLLRRTKIMTDRIRSEGPSDFNIIMKHRKTFDQRVRLATNRLRAAQLPAPTSRIVQ